MKYETFLSKYCLLLFLKVFFMIQFKKTSKVKLRNVCKGNVYSMVGMKNVSYFKSFSCGYNLPVIKLLGNDFLHNMFDFQHFKFFDLRMVQAFPNRAINKLIGQKYVCKLSGDTKNKDLPMGKWFLLLGNGFMLYHFYMGKSFINLLMSFFNLLIPLLKNKSKF